MTEPLRTQFRLDDFDVSVLLAGPEDGEPILLLHGIPTGAELWRLVATRLARAGHRVYAPDMPGYGLTRVPLDADFSLSGAAEVAAAWLRESRVDPVWVVGHDLGGGVAQILATRHPDLVSRMTLVNSIVEDSWPVRPVRVLCAVARLGLYPLVAGLGIADNPYTRWELRHTFADPSRLDEVDAARIFWDTKAGSGRQAFARHLCSLTSDDTLAVAGDLGRLDVPCQVVWGMEDVFQTWEDVGSRVRDLLPDPAVRQLEDCGHLTPLECPAELSDALLDWRHG